MTALRSLVIEGWTLNPETYHLKQEILGAVSRSCISLFSLSCYFSIVFGSGNSAETLQSPRSEYTVSFLPPLVLNFELPPDYPSTSPPVFTLRGKWLSQAQVCETVLTLELSFCGLG